MKNIKQNIAKKKFSLNGKKLIKQPFKILSKINIERLTKITSLSLKDKFKEFKERMKQKERKKIKLLN